MLLEVRDLELERRLAALRALPFPPGSRSLDPYAAWHALAAQYPDRRAFLYGTPRCALVYTYDVTTAILVVEAAIVDGVIRP